MIRGLVFGLMILTNFSISKCLETDWNDIEDNFLSREELVITDFTVDTNFKLNEKVEKWTSITLGLRAYSVGIDIKNSKKLVVIFTTLSSDGSGLNHTVKNFDLEENASGGIEFFLFKQDGKFQLYLVVYFPTTRNIGFFNLETYKLEKTWTIKLEYQASHVNIVKIHNKNFLMVRVSPEKEQNRTSRVVFYSFEENPENYWFSHPLDIFDPVDSFAISNFDDNYFLAFAIKSKHIVSIFKFENDRFLPHIDLESANVTQVVSFENGFKTFLAINGDSPNIYEFKHEGMKKASILNSNLEGLNYWLAIPIQTYRDDTILLAQKTLEHGTHISLDFDILTYNGFQFQEHGDILCNYFGEQNDLKCLGEYGIGLDISKSSCVIVEDKQGLLIPNANGSSFYMLHSEIRSLPNPMEKEIDSLIAEKELLQQLLSNTEKQSDTSFRFNIENNLPRSAAKSLDALQTLTKIKQLSTKAHKLAQEIDDLSKELNNINNKNKTYENIIFNAKVEITSLLQTSKLEVVNINSEEANNLLEDIVALNASRKMEAPKVFSNLIVNSLNFNNVNGIPKEDFILKGQGKVAVDGHVNFISEIRAENVMSNSVNNIEVEKEWVDVSRKVKGSIILEDLTVRETYFTNIVNQIETPKHFANGPEQLDIPDLKILESIRFPGNVTVENINGENLEKFLSKLCVVNIKCFIPNLKILGNISVSGFAKTKYLNDIKYPENFVLLESQDDEEDLIEISGFKNFINILRGYEVKISSTFNNLNPENFVTRNTQQNVTGKTTFGDIELESILEVNGKIKGAAAENILENMSLEESNNIKANVEFLSIEVLGNIIVQDQYDNFSLTEALNDLILQNHDYANITSTKNFLSSLTVFKNLDVASIAINNIKLNSIIIKEINETLNIDLIQGDLTMENLIIKGLFDEKNITELNRSLVKVTENASILSTLIFEKPVATDFLEIKDSLNDLAPHQYLFNSRNTEHIVLGDVTAENIIIGENFDGDVVNLNLSEIFENTLKYTGDQTIDKAYHLNQSILQNIKFKNVNGIPFNSLFSCVDFDKQLLDLITTGNANLNNLLVNGSIRITEIDDKRFSSAFEKKLGVKWLSNGNIVIEGNVHFDELNIQDLASENFNDFIQNLVFTDDHDINFKDTITFEKDAIVKKLLETRTINEIPIKNILRNDAEQEINGHFIINANVTLKEPIIAETINDVSTEYLANNFKINEDFLAMNGDVIFKHLAYVENLNLNGLINQQDLEDISSNIIKIDQNITLKEHVVFQSKVNLLGNLIVLNHTNGLNLEDVLKKVIWTTKNQTLSGPVLFAKSVEVFNFLNVDEMLNTRLLFNQAFEDKVKNAAFVNRGLLRGAYKFRNVLLNEFLTTNFINSVNFTTLIPLKLNQIVMDDINIAVASSVNDFQVKGNVNGKNLEEEINITKLINKPQTILSKVTFSENILVQGDISIGNLNNKPPKAVVYLNSDQNLTGSYRFLSKVWSDENVITTGLVNGVDLDRWNQISVKSVSKQTQSFTKDLKILDSVSFKNSLNSNGLMNDINLTTLQTEVEEKKKYRFFVEKGIRDEYANLCIDITYIYKNVQNQIYKFKYFEKLQELLFPSKVNQVKYFEFNKKHFILVNGEHCFSHLLEFNDNQFYFVSKINTGIIEQILVVQGKEDSLIFISRHSQRNMDCAIKNTTLIWQMNRKFEVKVIGPIEHQDLLQESLIRNTFYGISNNVVTEFLITENNQQLATSVKKWKIKSNKEDLAFMPRGLKTGLSLRTEKNLIFLNRHASAYGEIDENVITNNSADTEHYTVLNYTVKSNHYVPGKNGGEIIVANVGTKGVQKNLLVVTLHKKAKVNHRLDLIEIYSDPFSGELYDKIPTYNPSSLLFFNFGSGESMLTFLEDNRLLQSYEYKGIEGFVHKSTIKIDGDSLFLMDLPIRPHLNNRKVIGVAKENKITLLEAVMSGNKVKKDFNCVVPDY